jgi:drug/metabolite transporter (DMT)-like permease
MPNVPIRLILFLSSYAPLFLIIAMRGWRDSKHLAIGIAVVAVLSVIVLFIFLRSAQRLSAGKISISSVISRDGDAMSYIVTYLLPFLAVKLNDPTDAISLGIVLFVIGLLYVNSNMIHTNPILNIVGYHIFEIEDSDEKTTALICNRSYVRNGSELSVISIGDYVLLEKN